MDLRVIENRFRKILNTANNIEYYFHKLRSILFHDKKTHYHISQFS